MESITRDYVGDIYIAAELGNRNTFDEFPEQCKRIIEKLVPHDTTDVLKAVQGLPQGVRHQIVQCFSRAYRHNEIYDCLKGCDSTIKNGSACYCCARWEREIVDVENIITGSIFGLSHICYNNRHRIIDLVETNFADNLDAGTVPVFVFIGVEDDTVIEDDDVSQNVRLVDGAHRVVTLARAGCTEFDVCKGYVI